MLDEDLKKIVQKKVKISFKQEKELDKYLEKNEITFTKLVITHLLEIGAIKGDDDESKRKSIRNATARAQNNR